MQIIKLGATTSTNSYLKDLSKEKDLQDFTVVACDHQIQGRGQKGNSWNSEKGKNLTVSVLKKNCQLKACYAFMLNSLVSLSIYEALRPLSIPKLTVKWPNDIMSGNHKICGILIENSLQGEDIGQSVIGIGLNVNQEKFKGLPQASSLKIKTGKTYDLDVLLDNILNRLRHYFDVLEAEKYSELKEKYESVLFRRGITAPYVKPHGKKFNGTILGVTEEGQLKIKIEVGPIEYFRFKEVAFVY